MAVVPLLFGVCVVVAVFGLSGSAPLSKATDAFDVVPKQLKDGQVYLSYLDTDGKSGQRNLTRPDLFLIQFGYASKWNESVVRERVKSGLPIGLEGKELTDALRAYQRQNDLPLTGKLDVHTQRSMLQSRCGVSDVRRGRFTVFPNRWEHQNLSYNFVKYSERLPKSMIEVVFKQAFGYWEQVTALRFVRKPDDEKANIRIAFHTGYHGDGAHNSFDGPDGIFGHAFYPSDGHIHLDDQELFTEGTYKGMNLRIIAAHEIGHVLGLDHSWTKGSLMYPRYQGYVPHRKFRLASDDIAGIRHMYGPQKPIEVPDGLKYLDDSYLAAMMMADESVADPQRKTKYPAVRTTTATTTVKITAPTSVTTTTTTPFMTTTTHKPPVTVKAWPKPTARVGQPDPCESRIDSAFVWHDAAKYFLRGSLLYRQGPGESSMMSVAFPRDIRRYLIDAPLKTNAAVYSPYSSNLYLFHGRKMYVYDRLGCLRTTKKMTEPDFPDNIDSAFINRDGTVCFVKDDMLYEYDEWRHVIEKIVPLSSVYVGLPSNIDAVINDSPWVLDYEYIYFFKGPKYYKVNIKSLTVDKDYPRDIGGPWFGCKTWTVPK